MKYFIYFLKNFKFNSVQNVIHKTFAVFGCPKVACSRDGASDFFCYSPVNNALSPSRADARETVYSATHNISLMKDSCITRSELTVVFLNIG